MDLEVEFVDSAFRHGYQPEDFFEVANGRVLKVRSRRGLKDVHELHGRNGAGDYLHIAYRRTGGKAIVFHMRRMTKREKEMFRRWK
jgi:hypothetical protein